MSDKKKEPTAEEIERAIAAFKQHVAESQAMRFGSFKEIVEHRIPSLERHLGIKLSEEHKAEMRQHAADLDKRFPPPNPECGQGLLRVRPRPKSAT